MKKMLLAVLMWTAAACSLSTKVTRSWTSPEKNQSGYDNLFVAVVVSDITKRQILEDGIQDKLLKLGIESTASNRVIPPNFWNSTDLTKDEMIQAIRKDKKHAVMTVTLVDVKNVERYIPGVPMMGGPMMGGPMMGGPMMGGPMMGGPMMGPGAWGMGADFGGFWGMNHPMMMTPGHIVNDRKYFMEINIYDTVSELLVWSAQSKTLNPRSLEKFSSGFSEVVLLRMLEEGVLKRP